MYLPPANHPIPPFSYHTQPAPPPYGPPPTYPGAPPSLAVNHSAPKISGADVQKCYNCGTLGHWAQHCPEPRRQTPAGSGQSQARPNGDQWRKTPQPPVITRYPLPTQGSMYGHQGSPPQYSGSHQVRPLGPYGPPTPGSHYSDNHTSWPPEYPGFDHPRSTPNPQPAYFPPSPASSHLQRPTNGGSKSLAQPTRATTHSDTTRQRSGLDLSSSESAEETCFLKPTPYASSLPITRAAYDSPKWTRNHHSPHQKTGNVVTSIDGQHSDKDSKKRKFDAFHPYRSLQDSSPHGVPIPRSHRVGDESAAINRKRSKSMDRPEDREEGEVAGDNLSERSMSFDASTCSATSPGEHPRFSPVGTRHPDTSTPDTRYGERQNATVAIPYIDAKAEAKLAALGVTGAPKPLQQPRMFHSSRPRPDHPPRMVDQDPHVNGERDSLMEIKVHHDSHLAGKSLEEVTKHGTATTEGQSGLSHDHSPRRDSPQEIEEESKQDSQGPSEDWFKQYYAARGMAVPSKLARSPTPNEHDNEEFYPDAGADYDESTGDANLLPSHSRERSTSNAPNTSRRRLVSRKSGGRRKEFEPEESDVDEKGRKERKRQADDITPRLKRRQPKVAEAFR
ncbi:hypothetical protein MMC25_005933 [Agyrium rufum]|nr:hypothetical protein [Agyrium rufum]